MGRKKKKSTEEIQFENELLKLKMSAESGAIFHNEVDSNIPPEVENEFLNYVMNFETKFKDAKKVTIGERLQNPKFISYRKLNTEQLKKEILKIDKLLEKHGIVMHRVAETDVKKLYKFLTSEFMKHEIEDVQMKGLTNNFIFEEFFPNDENELRDAPESFLRDLFSKNPDWIKHHLAEKFINKKGKTIHRDKVVEALVYFQNAFDEFTKPAIEVKELQFTKKKATLIADVSYTAFENNSQTKMHGDATFKFRKGDLGYWQISSFTIPGFGF